MPVAFSLTGVLVCIALAIITSWAMSAFANMSGGDQVKGHSNTNTMSGASASAQTNLLRSSQANITLGSAGPITFVLTTPVIKAQTGGSDVPALSLDSETDASTSSQTGLITSSPYAQNEGKTFAKGTSMWQSSASGASKEAFLQPSPSLITSSPFAQNEGRTFSSGTSLWQSQSTSASQQASVGLWSPASASSTSKKDSSTSSLSMRTMSAPLPAQNIITASPFAANEGVKFSPSDLLWQSGASSTSSSEISTGKPSLITASPYANNEGVAFSKGTSLWQLKN